MEDYYIIVLVKFMAKDNLDNPETLKLILNELTLIKTSIYDSKNGMLVRLTRLEDNYNNIIKVIKWSILLLGIALTIIDLAIQNGMFARILDIIKSLL